MTTETIAKRTVKPLGSKLYGHIPHLPGSRMGTGDHSCHEGQGQICTVKTRDRHDRIIVTEKLDGSNCGVAKINNKIIPLTRAGYSAYDSHYPQHHMFGDWVFWNYDRFDALLKNGERCVGEWLALAHGTRYNLPHEPFVIFDIMRGTDRVLWDDLTYRCKEQQFVTPTVIHDGEALSIESAVSKIAVSGHGAIDPVEGAVWRVERIDPQTKQTRVDFLAKFVRHEKNDGCYLSDVSGGEDVWNWQPLATNSTTVS